MTLQTQYEINTVTNTSVLRIYANGVLITTFSIANGYVTAPAIESSVSVDVEVFYDNLKVIFDWLKIVKKSLSIPYKGKSDYKEIRLKKNDRVRYQYRLKDTDITDCVYKKEDGVIVFDPRPKLSINFDTFQVWITFLNEFITDIKQL